MAYAYISVVILIFYLLEMERLTMRTYIDNDKAKQSYDYDKQAWILDGVYVRCGHPETMDCKCYDKVHAGEVATITEHCK